MHNREKENNLIYEAPLVEIIEIEVEKGFAGSIEPLGDRKEDIDW